MAVGPVQASTMLARDAVFLPRPPGILFTCDRGIVIYHINASSRKKTKKVHPRGIKSGQFQFSEKNARIYIVLQPRVHWQHAASLRIRRQRGMGSGSPIRTARFEAIGFPLLR